MPGIYTVEVFFWKGSLFKSFVQEGEFWRRHLRGEIFCNDSLYKSFVEEGGFWRVLMPGIYVVKFFAMVHSSRVVCRKESFGVCWCLASMWWSFLQGFTLQEFCAGGRVLECWCLASTRWSFFAMIHSTRVLCRRDSSHAYWCLAFTLWSFLQWITPQELCVEISCMLMPGIFVAKFFAIFHSTRVVCRRESSGVYWCLASTRWKYSLKDSHHERSILLWLRRTPLCST